MRKILAQIDRQARDGWSLISISEELKTTSRTFRNWADGTSRPKNRGRLNLFIDLIKNSNKIDIYLIKDLENSAHDALSKNIDRKIENNGRESNSYHAAVAEVAEKEAPFDINRYPEDLRKPLIAAMARDILDIPFFAEEVTCSFDVKRTSVNGFRVDYTISETFFALTEITEHEVPFLAFSEKKNQWELKELEYSAPKNGGISVYNHTIKGDGDLIKRGVGERWRYIVTAERGDRFYVTRRFRRLFRGSFSENQVFEYGVFRLTVSFRIFDSASTKTKYPMEIVYTSDPKEKIEYTENGRYEEGEIKASHNYYIKSNRLFLPKQGFTYRMG